MLGTLPGWLTLLSVCAVGFFVWKGSGGQALEILQRANSVLAAQVEKLTSQNVEQAREIAVLQAKTDVSLALKPIVAAIERHENRAEVRSEEIVAALQRIGKATA